ncbi:cadherin-related family member 4 isoform X2 [Oncorhynchus mykiss]|uniref:cadherin-related family member 4 isoform X2 n=1 Tax=Oncorhynchus mykiss TaxID=8022 RepID=UPI001878A9A1|nr:cadherin-related family member 4 isoform X2 [Oncorhynchus mykiss]
MGVYNLIRLLLPTPFLQLHILTGACVSIATGFIGLPASVSVSESTRPRSVVVEFQVQSSSLLPTVNILSVNPELAVFETPIVNPTNVSGIFNVQIVLSGSLDYEKASMVSVRLGLVTSSGRAEQTFHIRVVDENNTPQCEPLLQLPGVEVHVPENLPVPVTLYTVLASDADRNDTLSFSISQVLPNSSKGQFHISGGGSILSSQPFDYHTGPRELILSVVVRDKQGANCTGTVRIKVLKVYNPPLDLLLVSQNVSIFENQGPEDIVATVRANLTIPDVLYTFVKDYPHFKIGREDGVIRTAYNLDLEAERALAHSVLLVRAYSVAVECSATATVTVNVLDVNEFPPFCSPSVFVLEVSETIEVGSSLGSLTCVDIDVSNQSVSLTLVDNRSSLFKFRLKDGQLQVNNTLNYDSAEMATNNFQYEATILATDTGTPPLTSQVRVLVSVTPVNEHDPVFQTLFFSVPEGTRPGTAVGTVVARDTDWPFDNIRYSITTGDDTMFTIDPEGGDLYLGGELDFEEQQVYVVGVQAEDYEQDMDRTNRKRRTVDITVQVENVNDNAPVCDPISYESTIFSTLSNKLPILSLSCADADSDRLTATITNGAAVDRFLMTGLSLVSKNMFSYVVDGVYDRTMFEVTISVSDGRHHTEAVAYIYVVPWTTTVPTTTTTTTTTAKPPQVVTVMSDYWDPEPWFVAVVTVTGVLLLLVTSLLIWAILSRVYGWGPKDEPEPPSNKTEEIGKMNTEASLDGSLSLTKASIQDDLMRFDGKAQDPVSGRSYLFNSSTGERRWL